MRTLHIFLSAGVVFALLGLANTATADIRNESILQGLTFVVDPGDGSVGMPDVSFDAITGDGAEEAQAVCAMTPGGSTANFMLEEPVVQRTLASAPPTSPDVELAPISSLNAPPPNRGGGGYFPGPGPDPNPDPDDDPDPEEGPTPSIVPEPATLMIVGLGLGAAAFASRRRRVTNK